MGRYSDNLFRKSGRPHPRSNVHVPRYHAHGPNANPKLKGMRGGNCNRTACQAPGADFWHTGTRAWYCSACMREINRANRDDAMALYGIPKLIICPESISAEERARWANKGIIVPPAAFL